MNILHWLLVFNKLREKKQENPSSLTIFNNNHNYLPYGLYVLVTIVIDLFIVVIR